MVIPEKNPVKSIVEVVDQKGCKKEISTLSSEKETDGKSNPQNSVSISNSRLSPMAAEFRPKSSPLLPTPVFITTMASSPPLGPQIVNQARRIPQRPQASQGLLTSQPSSNPIPGTSQQDNIRTLVFRRSPSSNTSFPNRTHFADRIVIPSTHHGSSNRNVFRSWLAEHFSTSELPTLQTSNTFNRNPYPAYLAAPVENNANFMDPKELLAKVVTAQDRMSRLEHAPSARLSFEAFNYGVNCLSPSSQDQFFSIYGRIPGSFTLESLAEFLQTEIAVERSKVACLQAGAAFNSNSTSSFDPIQTSPSSSQPSQGHSSSSTNQEPEDEESQNSQTSSIYRPSIFCKYCHKADHLIGHCPELAFIVCFRCYQLGHNRRHCPQLSSIQEQVFWRSN